MIDFPMKKLVNLLGIPHVWTDTHDNGCIFPSYPTIIARSYPHSISLCIIYVYSFHIYIYTYVYIYIYIHTCIYDFPNKSMVVSCKHSVYSNLRGVVFFPAPGRPATGSSSVPNQRSHWRATRSAGEKKEGTTD